MKAHGGKANNNSWVRLTFDNYDLYLEIFSGKTLYDNVDIVYQLRNDVEERDKNRNPTQNIV